MCQWGPPHGDPNHSEKKHWLIAARFSEFRDMVARLAERMRQVLPPGTVFPKLRKKNMMCQSTKKKIQERQEALRSFWIDLMKLLDDHPQLLAHINELDEFCSVSTRVTAIEKGILAKQGERKLKAEGRRLKAEQKCILEKWPHPMNGDMIEQAQNSIRQFKLLVQAAMSDVRYDQDIQYHLRVCLGFLSRLQASATYGSS